MPSPLFHANSMSYLTCSYPGLEFLCLHLRELRKCLRNELLFGKRFYSKVMHPRGGSLVAQTDGYYSYPAQTFLFSLPTHPWGPLPTSSSREKGSGTSRAQTHLPSRFGVHKSAMTWGAECRTFLCTSEGPFLLTHAAWPPRRETSGGFGVSWVYALPSPIQTLMYSGPAYMLFDPLVRTGFSACLHLGVIAST